ncbi:MAG: hypothetical protein KBD21_03655 [Candidatus Pacebacteria bacterium]|nr:hypothetical protein [Candidatus Paceibacterota bacterium]
MGTLIKKHRRLGKNQQRVLLLLSAGLALGLTHSPRTQWRIIQALPHAWRAIGRSNLNQASKALHRSGMVHVQKINGTAYLRLTVQGQRHAKRLQAQNITINAPRRWDGKWSVVAYDIPESERQIRLDLSQALKSAGFFEIQQSLFIHPYPCEHEVRRMTELCEASEYVYFMRVEHLTNDAVARKHFELMDFKLT